MTEKQSAGEAAQHTATGYQWESSVFLAMWRELTSRYGHDQAKEIACKVMYEAGLAMGRMAAEEIERRDARGVAEAWDLLYGPNPECTVELTDDRYVYRGGGCPAYYLWKHTGVSDEEIADMADAYCSVDQGFARAFGEDVRCVHTARLMKGDAYCEWLHTSGEEQEG